jgi:hypothetical protein
MENVMTRKLLGGLLAACWATGALAQGFTGAELSAEFGASLDDLDLGTSVYSGALDFGITPSIGLGAALTQHGFRDAGTDGSAYVLRGNYRLGSGLTAGLFWGQEEFEGADTTIWGIEAATALAGFEVQGYAGRWDGTGDGTLLGAEARRSLGDAFAITGSLDAVSGEDSRTRLAIGGAYRFGTGPEVFAELGRLTGEGDDDETSLTLGARIGLGPNGGVTFGQRGLLQASGGF